MLMKKILSKTGVDLVLLRYSDPSETDAVFIMGLGRSGLIDEHAEQIYIDIATFCFPPVRPIVYRDNDGMWYELLSPQDPDRLPDEYRRRWLDERPEDEDVDMAIKDYQTHRPKRSH